MILTLTKDGHSDKIRSRISEYPEISGNSSQLTIHSRSKSPQLAYQTKHAYNADTNNTDQDQKVPQSFQVPMILKQTMQKRKTIQNRMSPQKTMDGKSDQNLWLAQQQLALEPCTNCKQATYEKKRRLNYSSPLDQTKGANVVQIKMKECCCMEMRRQAHK